jgi:hypothetical protein
MKQRKNKVLNFMLACTALLFTTSSFGQQPQWYIKNYTASTSKLINFVPVPPVVSSPSTLEDDDAPPYVNKEADNAIYKANGDLCITIVDNAVFDASGNKMYDLYNGIGIGFPFSGSPYITEYDLAICRLPEDCDRHLIFKFSFTDKNDFLQYYIFNTATGFFEEIDGTPIDPEIPVKGNILHFINNNRADVQVTKSMAITKLNNSNERFIFFESEDDVFKATISASGVTFDSTSIFNFSGLIPAGAATRINETEVIQLPSGNYVYATSVYPNSVSSIGVFLYFTNGGVFTGSSTYNTSGLIKGLEFSENGNYLYLTKTSNPYLQYINMTSPATLLTLSPSGGIPGASKPLYGHGSIEIAHNGKLYFAKADGLSSLANSNDPTSAWTNDEIVLPLDKHKKGTPFLSDKFKLIPLPNQVDGEKLYTPNFSNTYLGCGEDIPEACMEYYDGFEYEWHEGMSLVHIGPCYTPDHYGTFTVFVTDENKCRKSYDIVFENDLPQIDSIPNVSYCSLNKVAPPYVGWYSNPLASYLGFYGIVWTYEGDVVPSGGGAYHIPYQGDGAYVATVSTACGSQTFMFVVEDELLEFFEDSIAEPRPDIYVGGNKKFVRVLAGGTFDYEWTITNGVATLIGTDEAMLYPYEPGDGILTITLKLIDHTNCSTHSNTIIWGDTIVTPERPQTNTQSQSNILESTLKIDAYPNPTDGNISVMISDFDSELNYIIQVLNLEGKKLIESNAIARKMDLDFSNLESGVYFIRVSNETGTNQLKTIKR